MEATAPAAYTLEAFVADLREITRHTTDPRRIIAQVRPLALRLAADPGWVRPEHYRCDEAQGFGSHVLHEEPDHALAVFAFSWLPGRGAPPHDHKTWAVVAGVDGEEHNIFWRRVDDGTRPGYAEIVEAGTRSFGPGDVLSLLPDGIHSVENRTGQVTLSLHVYGVHVNHTGRSTFDPQARTETPFTIRTSD